MRNASISRVSSCCLVLLAFGLETQVRAAVPVGFSQYNRASEINVSTPGSDSLRIQWNTRDGGRWAKKTAKILLGQNLIRRGMADSCHGLMHLMEEHSIWACFCS